jgi:hypothetical protein
MPKKTPEKHNPGPVPEILKIEGDWKDAMKRTLAKKRPAEGWPKPDKPKKS